MTSPHVVELPRKREPAGRDTFLADAPAVPLRTAARIDNVVQLRPRPLALVPPPAPRGAA